jgi:hypothetical protein
MPLEDEARSRREIEADVRAQAVAPVVGAGPGVIRRAGQLRRDLGASGFGAGGGFRAREVDRILRRRLGKRTGRRERDRQREGLAEHG